MCPEPFDIGSCFDAMISALECVELGLITTDEFEEYHLALKSIARAYTLQLLSGNTDREDGFDAQDHRF